MKKYATRIACVFNALLDVEIGIIRVIRDELNIQDDGQYVFNQFTLNSKDDALKALILEDEDDDLTKLLTVGITDETRLDLASHICNQMYTINKWYRKALDRAIHTSIYKLCSMWVKADIAIVTVLCKNPLEEQVIKQLNPKFKTVVNELDLTSYDVIYVRRFAEILKYHEHAKLSAKEIIVPVYWSNMQPDDKYKPNGTVSLLVGSVNKIKTINPYDNFQLPVDEDK